MLIEVTQADIDTAKNLLETSSLPRCQICPIATAANRVINQVVVVGKTGIFDRRTLNKYIELPLVARSFIDDFDHGVEVKPFTFEVQSWD